MTCMCFCEYVCARSAILNDSLDTKWQLHAARRDQNCDDEEKSTSTMPSKKFPKAKRSWTATQPQEPVCRSAQTLEHVEKNKKARNCTATALGLILMGNF